MSDTEEEKLQRHSELLCDDSVFTRIPWLPSRKKTASFLDSKFCREFSADIENGIKNPGCKGDPKLDSDQINDRIDLHQILAELFPFFLPSRYHTMNAVQMQKCAASPGSYWTNALHFVRTCSDQGTVPYYNLIMELQNNPRPLVCGCIEHEVECKFKDFKEEGGPEQCRDPAEFLLEPWVLLQLPFQPALLHQWSVGALAEALKFSVRLVRISAGGYQEHFHELVGELYGIGQILSSSCNMFLTAFFATYCMDPQLSLGAKSSKMSEEFSTLLGQTVARLEFILGRDCAEILDKIQISPSSNVAPSSLKYFNRMPPILCANFMPSLHVYYEKVWHSEELDPLRLWNIDPFSISEEMIADNPDLAVEKDRDVFRISEDLIKKFVLQNLQIRPIEGLKNLEVFAEGLAMYMGELNFRIFKSHFFYVHYVLKGRHRRTAKLEQGGVELDILDLRGQVQAKNSHATMMSLIRQAAEKYDRDLFTHDVDSPDLKFLESALEKIEIAKANHEKWTTNCILQLAKASCESGEEEESLPYLSLNTEEFQEHVTRRIQQLVLKMYKQHYTTISTGTLHFHPECHFVQYVLPCFVAMIMDVDQDPKVDSKTKIDYKQFVHEVIKSFEHQPYVQVLAEEKIRNFIGKSYFERDLKTHLGAIQKSLQSAFVKSPKLQGIVSKFRFLNIDSRGYLPFSLLCTGSESDEKTFSSFYPVDSKIQFSRLCYRLSNSLQKINWMNVPFDEDITFNFVGDFKLLTNDAPAVEKALDFFYSRDSDDVGELVTNLNNSTQKPKKGAAELTPFQLFSTALFVAHKHKMSMDQFYCTHQGPLFLLDPLQWAVHHFLMDNRWQVKSFLANLWQRMGSKDRGAIPLEVIMRCLCCRPLRDAINTKTMKLKMEKQGEDSFHPVRHCRWCGLVNARPFRLCPECKDEPDYPHPNYFCSVKCEKVALEKFHTEEHAKFVMEGLGIGL